jgi:CubicO group peptidase (beta-lactamase class C family)
MESLLSNLNTFSLLVYKDGKQVYEYGDIGHKLLIKSCRKSVMNCMFGLLMKNNKDKENKLDLNMTIRDLEIDDIDGLTEEEKNATIMDLLQSKSGIYHNAAYESDLMKKNKPVRGSHTHGTFWCYNNWDFNVLCYIYNKLSGSDFYVDVCKLGKELEMEDLILDDCNYVYESETKYPAYDFKMSTRDMIKFGLLYLQNGVYGDKQIIDKEWIDETVKLHTADIQKNPWPAIGYGLMWWIDEWGYGAFGVGGHMIAVLPTNNMVIVHRVDNEIDESKNRVSVDDLNKIIDKCKELYCN